MFTSECVSEREANHMCVLHYGAGCGCVCVSIQYCTNAVEAAVHAQLCVRACLVNPLPTLVGGLRAMKY